VLAVLRLAVICKPDELEARGGPGAHQAPTRGQFARTRVQLHVKPPPLFCPPLMHVSPTSLS
jgi:hypothetical protein